MISPEVKRALDNQQTVLVVIWTAFIVSLIVYLLIPEAVFPRMAPAAGDPFSDPIRSALWAVSLAAMGFYAWWRRRYLTKEALLEGARTAPVIALFSRYMGRKIVAFAVAESLALYGLLLVFFGRYFWDQYLLSIVSAVLLIVEFPSRVFPEELVRGAESRGA